MLRALGIHILLQNNKNTYSTTRLFIDTDIYSESVLIAGSYHKILAQYKWVAIVSTKSIHLHDSVYWHILIHYVSSTPRNKGRLLMKSLYWFTMRKFILLWQASINSPRDPRMLRNNECLPIGGLSKLWDITPAAVTLMDTGRRKGWRYNNGVVRNFLFNDRGDNGQCTAHRVKSPKTI